MPVITMDIVVRSIQPLNFDNARATEKSDASPLEVDASIGWGSIGGLDNHIHSVKEMVMLPLLYPQV